MSGWTSTTLEETLATLNAALERGRWRTSDVVLHYIYNEFFNRVILFGDDHPDIAAFKNTPLYAEFSLHLTNRKTTQLKYRNFLFVCF